MPSGSGDKIEAIYPVGAHVDLIQSRYDDLKEMLTKFRELIKIYSSDLTKYDFFKNGTCSFIEDLSEFIEDYLFPEKDSTFAEHFRRLEEVSKEKIVHLQIITNDFQIPWWLTNCYTDNTLKLCEGFALGILPLKSSYNPDRYFKNDSEPIINETTPKKVPIALISRPTKDLKDEADISTPISGIIKDSSNIYPIEINAKDGVEKIKDQDRFIGINVAEGRSLFNNHQIVIYNGHFHHAPKTPKESYFEFTKKRNPNEIDKLYLDDFSTSEKVVILCGCNTIGLTTEFIESEDPTTPNLAELYDAFHWICIGTLYPIFPESVKVFLEFFVKNAIKRGLSIGEALRKTRLDMKEAGLNVFDWAPYTLLGPASALLPGIKKQNILFSFPKREENLLENILNNKLNDSFFTYSFNSDPKRAAKLGLTDDFSNHTIEIGIEPITTVFKDILAKPDSTKILGVAYSTKDDMYLVIDKALGISSFEDFEKNLKEKKIKILTNKSDLPRALFVRMLLNKKHNTNNDLLELCKHEDCSQCKKIHLCWVELPLDYYNAFCCGFGDGAILRRDDIKLPEIPIGQEIQIESGGYKRDAFVIGCVDNLLNEVARHEGIPVEIPLTAWVARIKQGKSFEDISIKYAIREFCRNIPENQETADQSVILQKSGDIKSGDVDVIKWLFDSSSSLGDFKAEDWNIISNSFLNKEGNKFSK